MLIFILVPEAASLPFNDLTTGELNFDLNVFPEEAGHNDNCNNIIPTTDVGIDGNFINNFLNKYCEDLPVDTNFPTEGNFFFNF